LLGEHRLRDINDEINELLKEKRAWEDRIRELGGPDYRTTQPAYLEKDALRLPG